MGYYVYELIDPRDGSVFYVGKGKGGRVHQHAKDAKKGRAGKKCDRIREILACGKEVGHRIAMEFDSEDDAYAYEKDLIESYGLGSLTNIASGGREMTSELVESRREARTLARATCRALHVLSKHAEVGFRFGGKWIDIDRKAVRFMTNSAIMQVVETLGESEARHVFSRHNVSLAINA